MKKNVEKNVTPDMTNSALDEKARDYILREHPEEKKFIGRFSRTITFREIADRMVKLHENFYEITNCGESFQREICFARLAELTGTDYDYWYYTWLNG